ncbi:hypothetical protein [Nonomuraea sp. NPDC049309]|uniref:hypothetical protein n=1 Tax=Nonomuraea sp. NPDC049309 TaxID=3364350 RepID=UPI003710A697
MGGIWARFKTKTSSRGINGDSPDPPPEISAPERRMATDLGDALTAYWRNGNWFGTDELIYWMIDHGHLSEAAYVLDQVMDAPGLSAKAQERLGKCVRRLEKAKRAGAAAAQTERSPDASRMEAPGHPSAW